jgi:hypothetical protein
MDSLKNQLREFPPRTEVDVIRQAVYVTRSPDVEDLIRQILDEPDGLIAPEILKTLKIISDYGGIINNIAFEIDCQQPKCCLIV